MALVVGVDSSTQSTKVEAHDVDTGAVVATGSARHPPTSPPVSEQHPDAWWFALCEAIGQLGPARDDVIAISVAGQQHGLVLVDESGRPVRAAKLWNDTTSASAADAMVAERGREWWATATGSVPVAAFTVSKLAWIATHEPDALDLTARIMLPHDYVTWRLSGSHVTDRGDASGTGWYDPDRGSYVSDALVAAGVDRELVERLPRVLGPREPAGSITDEASAELGLPASCLVGPGTGDNMAGALGLGLGPGDVVISLGTSGTVYAASTAATHDTSGAVAGFAGADGGFLPLVCTLNATKVTDTVAGWLSTDAPGLAALALSTVEDPGVATLVPYFDGERTPDLPGASGLLTGLTNATTREQLALAAHDGVLCGLLDGLDALRAVGASTIGRRFLIGGGARSAAYRQRAADLLGSSVTVPDAEETVATGAAVQAAMVALERDLDEVAVRWRLGAGSTVEPRHDTNGVRERYRSGRAAVGG